MAATWNDATATWNDATATWNSTTTSSITASAASSGSLSAVINRVTLTVAATGAGTLSAAINLVTLASAATGSGSLSATIGGPISAPASGSGSLSAVFKPISWIDNGRSDIYVDTYGATVINSSGVLTANTTPLLNPGAGGSGSLSAVLTPIFIVTAAASGYGVPNDGGSGTGQWNDPVTLWDSPAVKWDSATLTGTQTGFVPVALFSPNASGSGSLTASLSIEGSFSLALAGSGSLSAIIAGTAAAASGSGTLSAILAEVTAAAASGNGALSAAIIPRMTPGATGAGLLTANINTILTAYPGLPVFRVGPLGGRTERTISIYSVETRLVPVIATRSGVAYNPTGDDLHAALVPQGSARPTSWFNTGVDWETWNSPWGVNYYFARILIGAGPSVLTKGIWDIWLQIADGKEIVDIACPSPLIAV